MNTTFDRTHHVPGNGIDEFHDYITSHTNFTHTELEYIFRAMRVAQRIHHGEFRKISSSPSIHHLLAIVQEELHADKEVHWKSIITLLFHDTIRSHPDLFREVFDIVPLDVFYRILKLSNLSAITRHTLYKFLKPRIQNNAQDIAILDMLSYDLDEMHEIQPGVHDNTRKLRMDLYMSQCREYIDIYYPHLNHEGKLAKLNGLFHYIFFDKIDAKHKLRVTMHNFGDINLMPPINKRRYMLSRIPKFQALAVILVSLGMLQELEKLKGIWEIAGGKINDYNNFVIHHALKHPQNTVAPQVQKIISI